MKRAFTGLLLAAMVIGCPRTFYPGTPPCEQDVDCSIEKLGSEFAEHVCHQERCIPILNVPEDDAGPQDAGVAEAGVDASSTDAGGGDSGVVDAGPMDAAAPDSGPLPPENLAGGTPCTDGEDNDRDGDTDCDDSDCANLLFCADEICDNDWDDNADGLMDCDDPNCSEHSYCQPRVTICDLMEAGYFNSCSSCHTDQRNQQGNITNEADGDYRIDDSSPESLFASMSTPGSQRRQPLISGNADQSLVFAKLNDSQAQLDPACADGDQACIAARGARMPRGGVPLTVQALEEVRRWIELGDLERCLEGFPVEDCQDQIDNDGDNRVDCDDLDCRTHLLCSEPSTICEIQEAGIFLPCINCHVSQNLGGLRLNTASAQGLYDSLVGVNSVAELPLIAAGDHLGSYLYLKLSGEHLNTQGGAGERMPLSGDPTPQRHLDMLRSWINRGETLDHCLENPGP